MKPSILLCILIFYYICEELHFKLATGKSSYWWMCNQRLIKQSHVLDKFDFK